MTGIVILLVIFGFFCLAGKTLSAIARFFGPTGRYIKRRIIDAIVQSIGISRDAANALWPLLVIAVIVIIALIIF